MQRTAFNDGWTVRPKVDRWTELGGVVADRTPVTLPHDAMIGTERSAAAGPANAFFVGGVWEYQRALDLTDEEPGGPVTLEFEGVYRDAFVYVNDEAFAGPACTTFDGRALAVVRPTGSGAVTVRVAADGCEPREIRINLL